MKKIFTLSILAIVAAVFMTSCSKNVGYNNQVDENYWLSKERGEVVYSDPYCNYYVVETYYGFTVIQAYGSYRPYEGSMVYGNFSSRGTRDMYNQSTGNIFTGMVTDYWLTYTEAQDALDYYCPYGKAGVGNTSTRVFKESNIKEQAK